MACKIGDPNSGPAQVMQVSSAPVQIGFTLLGGQAADCIWFNIPLAPTPTPTSTSTPPPTATATAATQSSANPAKSNPNPTTTPQATGPATLTIVKHTCPRGYDVFAKSADPETDCPDATENVQFSPKSSAGAIIKHKTASDGSVTFNDLKAGPYQLAATLPAGVTSAFIWSCTSNVRDFSEYPFAPFARLGTSGLIGVTLEAGENLECSWYDVPSKSAATATVNGTVVKITVLSCPGQSVVLSQCTAAASGVQFTLKPSGGSGQSATLETDDTGIANGQIQPGTYKLEELGGNWCLADSSAFDNDVNLVVASDAVEVSIYNCEA